MEMKKKVMLDPGHGGYDPGAIGKLGLQEKDVNLKLALKVGKLLESWGISVAYTRIEDGFVSLEDRVHRENVRKSDCFVSVHCNSFASATASGTETYAATKTSAGAELATAVYGSLSKAIGRASRGVKFQKFAVIANTNCPATLVEVAFISNAIEEALLKDESFLNKAAKGIGRGIAAYLRVEVINPEEGKTIVPIWQENAFNELVKKGVINTPEVWKDRLEDKITIGEVMGLLEKLI